MLRLKPQVCPAISKGSTTELHHQPKQKWIRLTVVENKPGTSCLLSKGCVTELYSQPAPGFYFSYPTLDMAPWASAPSHQVIYYVAQNALDPFILPPLSAAAPDVCDYPQLS